MATQCPVQSKLGDGLQGPDLAAQSLSCNQRFRPIAACRTRLRPWPDERRAGSEITIVRTGLLGGAS
jgi:hypothetical protein